MTYKTLPFLTKQERDLIRDSCTRTEDGCLIFQAAEGLACHLIRIRGQLYSVARIVWAETFGITCDAMLRLNTHDVIHIAECPNVGYGKPLCVEPTHLALGTITQRVKHANERRTA